VDRERVSSTNIRSVGYDAASETLEVEFKDGDVYRYSPVPARVHDALMAAPSHGKYFNAHIKNAGYRCTPIR
jgi:hypothetical protein